MDEQPGLDQLWQVIQEQRNLVQRQQRETEELRAEVRAERARPDAEADGIAAEPGCSERRRRGWPPQSELLRF